MSERPDRLDITVGTVTTSFPLTADEASGIFIYRLLQHFPKTIRTIVITPASRLRKTRKNLDAHIELVTVRYAPRPWRLLAHGGGGIPAALTRNPWRYLLLPPLLLTLLAACVWQARRVDLFHAHWSINGLISGIAGKLAGKPVITTLRGSDVNLAAKSPAYRALLRWGVRLSMKVVTVDNSLRAEVHKLIPHLSAEKLSVVENGVDDHYLQVERRARATGTAVNLITVGNLTANKGTEQVLRAVHDLADPNCRVQVVGDGPERRNLIELAAALGMKDRIEFQGAVPPQEVVHHLAKADVFVLASYSEGRPNAMLEAMATGLPVVASDLPGIRSVINSGVNGLLFSVGSISELTKRLAELTGDAILRNTLGTAARRSIVAGGFHWRDAAKRYEKLYREILATRPLS